MKIEDCEPLNAIEQAIHDNLNKHLNLDAEYWNQLTPEQKFSAARVINRQGAIKTAFFDNREKYIGIQFSNIFIGIERDGYAHS